MTGIGVDNPTHPISSQSFRGIRERKSEWLTFRTLGVVLPTLQILEAIDLPKEDGHQEILHSRKNGASRLHPPRKADRFDDDEHLRESR